MFFSQGDPTPTNTPEASMNVNTSHIENLAIGSEFTFSAGRFGVTVKRYDATSWVFDLLTSDMEPSGNWSQVYPSRSRKDDNVRVLRARADFDDDSFFVSQTEHVGTGNAIRDALVILTNG